MPQKLDIHIVVDNYATHKHAAVKHWLAAHNRWHVHYTPTYTSRLDQVEIWFNIITQRAIRQYNRHPKPFVWTATTDSILAKIERLCQRISGTQH